MKTFEATRPSVAAVPHLVVGDRHENADRARQELTIQYAAKVRLLSPADLRLVTACAKTRNAIVHRSPGSVDEMNHERSRP
jgi:hypothetical protein